MTAAVALRPQLACERVFAFPGGDIHCSRPADAYITVSHGTRPALRIASKRYCSTCALKAANVAFAFGCTVSMASINGAPVPFPVAS